MMEQSSPSLHPSHDKPHDYLLPKTTKVMIVDDSTIIRGFLTRILSAQTDINIVASVADGLQAIESIKHRPVDVVILDIEMPNMDGLTAIPLLLDACPAVKIIMASTLTLKNADISLKAIEAGAADYIPKPTTASDLLGSAEFSLELVRKVRVLGASARRQVKSTQFLSPLAKLPNYVTRPVVTQIPQYIAIGSSTGGPQALFKVLKGLNGLSQPILITQHMPASFTTMLASHITKQCNINCVEGEDGMIVSGGNAYLAPGGFHMTLTNKGAIALNQDPLENYCRPSVDVMLRSLAALNQPCIVVVLTGMGQDGLKGCQAVLAASKSNVIAQDEATSVVWGMPGMVANAGICSAILPIEKIGAEIRRLSSRN